MIKQVLQNKKQTNNKKKKNRSHKPTQSHKISQSHEKQSYASLTQPAVTPQSTRVYRLDTRHTH